MLHASSTLTMGTPMPDRLATAVGSRRRTIDHSHPAMLDAIYHHTVGKLADKGSGPGDRPLWHSQRNDA